MAESERLRFEALTAPPKERLAELHLSEPISADAFTHAFTHGLGALQEPARHSELTFAPHQNSAGANPVAALIQRVEAFTRANLPSIALTLRNDLHTRVEIQKVGPRRVALRLVGGRGALPTTALTQLREELTSRGISIAALSSR
jgi:hypothetical protein